MTNYYCGHNCSMCDWTAIGCGVTKTEAENDVIYKFQQHAIMHHREATRHQGRVTFTL